MSNQPARIALIGMRGSGKTTLGKLLAESLGHPFVDCDKELENRLGIPIRDMFSQFGEPWFRDREAECLADLIQRDCWIMACGGGVILREDNRSLLRNNGLVIWLDANPGILAERVTGDPWSLSGRPPLTGPVGGNPRGPNEMGHYPKRSLEEVHEELTQLLSKRKHFYETTAHLRFSSESGSPTDWLGKLQKEIQMIQPAKGGI